MIPTTTGSDIGDMLVAAVIFIPVLAIALWRMHKRPYG